MNKFLLVFLVLVSASQFTFAKHKNFQPANPGPAPISEVATSGGSGDSRLVQDVSNHRGENFVEAKDVTVSELSPDDTQGLPHQKWYVKLSSGAEIQCVYNLDMGTRIPLKVGDRISIGGQFIWTNQGGLVHWLHEDPSHRRPDGYVIVNGQTYGVH